jgi:hypothetical protein
MLKTEVIYGKDVEEFHEALKSFERAHPHIYFRFITQSDGPSGIVMTVFFFETKPPGWKHSGDTRGLLDEENN